MTLAYICILFIAALHVFAFIAEFFLWRWFGRRLFGKAIEDNFEVTRRMAQNQGAYNLFLAGGLIWSVSLAQTQPAFGQSVAVFFLLCVVVAGFVGWVTVYRKPQFLIQALPPLLPLGLFLFG